MPNFKPPSQTEKKDFFHKIAKEQQRNLVILSITEPYIMNSLSTPLMTFQGSCVRFSTIGKQLYSVAVNGWELHTGESNSSNGKPLGSDGMQAGQTSSLVSLAERVAESGFKQVVRTDPRQPSLSFSSCLHFTAWYMYLSSLAQPSFSGETE